jgi:hypothetical protein
MVKKTDIDNLITKYQPVLKKTGDQLSKAVKTAEDDIAKLYQKVQTHLGIQMKNLKKEKLYYDIGKYVADHLEKNDFDQKIFNKFKKELTKIDSEGRKMQKKLKSIDSKGAGKRKKTVKKQTKKTLNKN